MYSFNILIYGTVEHLIAAVQLPDVSKLFLFFSAVGYIYRQWEDWPTCFIASLSAIKTPKKMIRVVCQLVEHCSRQVFYNLVFFFFFFLQVNSASFPALLFQILLTSDLWCFMVRSKRNKVSKSHTSCIRRVEITTKTSTVSRKL